MEPHDGLDLVVGHPSIANWSCTLLARWRSSETFRPGMSRPVPIGLYNAGFRSADTVGPLASTNGRCNGLHRHTARPRHRC